MFFAITSIRAQRYIHKYNIALKFAEMKFACGKSLFQQQTSVHACQAIWGKL